MWTQNGDYSEVTWCIESKWTECKLKYVTEIKENKEPVKGKQCNHSCVLYITDECEADLKGRWAGDLQSETKRSTKEYEQRTDINSPTGPNKAVRVAKIYYCSIYLIERKRQQSGRLLPTHSSLQPKLDGRGSDAMYSSIENLAWNLYWKVKKES